MTTNYIAKLLIPMLLVLLLTTLFIMLLTRLFTMLLFLQGHLLANDGKSNFYISTLSTLYRLLGNGIVRAALKYFLTFTLQS